MTCTSSRSCSHSTVSICLVHGRSAIPPLSNLSIAVRSQFFPAPTIVAIFSLSWIVAVKKILTYSGIPRRKPKDFAYLSVTDECRSAVASFSGKSAPFSVSFVKRFRVLSPCFSVACGIRCCTSGECLEIATLSPLKINMLTSRSAPSGRCSCHSQNPPPIYSQPRPRIS